MLQGAERIGAGRFAAFRKGASTLVVLPPGDIGKPLLWYTEVVRVPAGAVTADRGLGVTSRLARFERVGNVVHVRDLSTTQQRRAGATPGEAPVPGDSTLSLIHISMAGGNKTLGTLRFMARGSCESCRSPSTVPCAARSRSTPLPFAFRIAIDQVN